MSLEPKKKILILGGSGFIGLNLVEHYSQLSNYEVHATHFKRPAIRNINCQWHQVDLRNANEVDALLRGQDIVVQAAATTSGSKDIIASPFLHVTDNAIMNSYILRSAFENKIKHFVFFSCTVMYPSLERAIKEIDFDSENVHPKYFGIAWTKVYIEKMCEFYSRLGSTKYTAIRHSNIYGPHDKYDLEKSHVFGATVAKVMRPIENKIVVWGNGEEERDLLHCDDLVSFVDLALQKQENLFELVNVGLGRGISIRSLVELMVQISGKKLNIEFDLSKPTIPTKVFLDISKARSWGWIPKVDLAEGIKKTLQWYRENYEK